MLRFLHDVIFERCFDLSMDWGERASLERPLEAGRLQRYRRSRRQCGKGNNKRWVSFILFNVW
jgi:hypothetical protein